MELSRLARLYADDCASCMQLGISTLQLLEKNGEGNKENRNSDRWGEGGGATEYNGKNYSAQVNALSQRFTFNIWLYG